MIIATQLRRRSDPNTLAPVLVYPDDITIKFDQSSGTPSSRCELRIRVYSDPDVNDVPDTLACPIPGFDCETRHDVEGAGPLGVVDDRLRGSGNFMAQMRSFCESRVTAWNESISPGGTAATFRDVDDDNPIV